MPDLPGDGNVPEGSDYPLQHIPPAGPLNVNRRKAEDDGAFTETALVPRKCDTGSRATCSVVPSHWHLPALVIAITSAIAVVYCSKTIIK